MFTRPSPTSRGLGRCVSFRMGRGREQTAAGPRAGACRLRGVWRRCLAPVGKGRCRCAGSTLFALRAKALQSGTLDHGVSRERAGFSERFAHQGNLPARRGTGERAAPRRGRRYTPSRRQNAPASRQNLPHHPTAANAALYKARLIARRGKPPRRAPRTGVPRLFTTHPRLFTTHPRLFTAHPVPFTTFPHLLRSAHVFSSHFMPFAPLRAFMAFCAICGAFPALYDFPTPAYGHSAPFAAHPAPFTTFPHLLWPLRAFYSLSAPVSVLFAPLTAIPCLFTAAFLRPFRTCLWPIHAFMAFYDLSHAICGASRAFHDFPTPFMATPCLLLPFRACFRAIRAFNSHPVPVSYTHLDVYKRQVVG